MEKIKFQSDGAETAEYFVMEQTNIKGTSYILVTDSAEGDAECRILQDRSEAEDTESIYEIVEDDTELSAVSKVFEELLEDIEIER